MTMQGLTKPTGILRPFLKISNGILSIIRRYSSNLVPFNYHLLPFIHRELVGYQFKSGIEVKHIVHMWFKNLDKNFFFSYGNYVEK